MQSIIQGTDGHFLPGTFFAHYLKEFDHAIQRFQVVQDEPGRSRFASSRAAAIPTTCSTKSSPRSGAISVTRSQIDVEFVEDIALVRTGKHLASISRLPVDFQRAAPVVIRAGDNGR